MAKLVIDSSVWIDFFNKKTSAEIEEMKKMFVNGNEQSPVIILPVIMEEVLQGVEDTRQYHVIKENLLGFEFISYDNYEFAIKAAKLFTFLPRKGVTIPKANDCLIASICIQNDFLLVHQDRDFNQIAKHTALKIYK
jgi:predicted nucleic acid-binding protein